MSASVSKHQMVCPACNARYEEEHAFCPRDGTPMIPDNTVAGDELLGRVLDDRYRITGKLGVGGMGEVYEAEHVYIEKHVAIKLLRRDIMSSPEAVSRFHNEARAASAIGHENIVEIDDFGRMPDGRVYLVMERLSGQSLADAARSAMPLSRVIDIVCQVCRGLEAAHRKGIIHRDIKPENIFLTEKHGREVVKLLDFGIAKVSESSGGHNLTRTGTIFGTPHYMSPEQARGAGVDLRADVYALGVILYELLVGNVPFRADSFMAILMQHVSQPPLPPRQAAPERNIPPAVEAAVLRAMSKSPDDRFPSAEAFEKALWATQEEHVVRLESSPNVGATTSESAPTTPTPATQRGASSGKHDPLPLSEGLAKRPSGPPLVLEKSSEIRVGGVRRPRSEWSLGAAGSAEWQADGSQVLVGSTSVPRNRAILFGAGLGALGLVLLLGTMMSRGKSNPASDHVDATAQPQGGQEKPAASGKAAQQGKTAVPNGADAGRGSWSHVMVESDPPGATLSSEGRWIGQTPEQVSMRPGTSLRIVLHREGYKDTPTVIAPGTEKVFVRLEPLAAAPAAPDAGLAGDAARKGKRKGERPVVSPKPAAQVPPYYSAPAPLPTPPPPEVEPTPTPSSPSTPEVLPLPPKQNMEAVPAPSDTDDHGALPGGNGDSPTPGSGSSDDEPNRPAGRRSGRGRPSPSPGTGEDQPLDPY